MLAISVIVPAHDAASYLRESLDSVLAQYWDGVEVIVVDDGSTDATPGVLAAYADRVRIVRIDHGGLAAARNRGLEEARGEWIAFHDADDVTVADRFRFQLGVVRAEGCDALFCNGEFLHDPARHVVPSAVARRCQGRLLCVEDVFTGFPVYFQAALVRRRAFEEVGNFDPTLHIYPDHDYGYRLFSRVRCRFVERTIFRYRIHETNLTRDRLRGREELARILDRLRRDDPGAVRRIGARRLRARLARHYYRIARQHLAKGSTDAVRAALGRALDLRPMHPRYRWLRLRYAL